MRWCPWEIPRALLSFVQLGASFREAMAADVGRDSDGEEAARGESGESEMAAGEEATGRPSGPRDLDLPDLVRRNSQSIDTLCAVLNGPNAALAQKRVKRRLLEDVLSDLDVSLPANDDDPTFRIVFEYATGGLLALMAYRAETDFAYPVETFLQCLAPRSPRRPAHRPFGEGIGSRYRPKNFRRKCHFDPEMARPNRSGLP